MTATRLPSGGRLINRKKPIEFTFDGKKLAAYEGDTLASALIANDELLVGRSFKYHLTHRSNPYAGNFFKMEGIFTAFS